MAEVKKTTKKVATPKVEAKKEAVKPAPAKKVEAPKPAPAPKKVEAAKPAPAPKKEAPQKVEPKVEVKKEVKLEVKPEIKEENVLALEGATIDTVGIGLEPCAVYSKFSSAKKYVNSVSALLFVKMIGLLPSFGL